MWIAPPKNIYKQSFINYQSNWINDKSKYKIGVKSRRCGLTWSESFDDVTLSSTKAEAGGMDTYYLSTKEELAKEFIATCKDWVEAIESTGVKLVENPKDDLQSLQIKFKSGYKIQGLTSNPKNLRGLQGRIVIDEAAWHDNLAATLKAAIACTMWKGDIRLISTLNGLETFYQEWQKALQGAVPASVHFIPIDKALRDGLYLKIHQKKGLPLDLPDEELEELEKEWLEELLSIYGEAAREELYCIPSSGQDNYFSAALIQDRFTDDSTNILQYFQSDSFQKLEKHEQLEDTKEWCNNVLMPLIDRYLTLNYTSYLGMDFARLRHLSVISVLFHPYEGTTFCPIHIELRKVPYSCQAKIVEKLLLNLKDCLGIALDATGNALSLAEDLEYLRQTHSKKKQRVPFKVFPVKFNQASLIDIFNNYQIGLESKKLILPSDLDVKADHLNLQEKNNVPKAIEFDSIRNSGKGIVRHCDSAYSLALAYHCLRKFDPDTEIAPKKLPNRARIFSYGSI
jgi:phage FluMu gp28-like protein